MPGAIVGILLAAGRGSRFGGDKLLHRLPDGTPMAVAAAANFRPACERLVAVVRTDCNELAELLAAADCEIVRCLDADKGMAHSLAAGVRSTVDAAGWIVALADMPFIACSSYRVVADRLRAGASLAASQYRGRRGHPVGFSSEWHARLSSMTGDQGGQTILTQHQQYLILCPVDDPGVIWDIDHPEDLFRTSEICKTPSPSKPPAIAPAN